MFAGESEEVRMSEGLLVKPSGDYCGASRCDIEHRPRVLDSLFECERLQIQLRIEPRCRFGQTLGVGEVVGLGRETDAVIHAFDAEGLELIPDGQREVGFADTGDVLQVIQKEDRSV